MAGLLLLCEMTIIMTIAPHLENGLMQNTAQNSQEASFKKAPNFTSGVLCLCPELMDPSHQRAVNRSRRGQGVVGFLETQGIASLGWRV